MSVATKILIIEDNKSIQFLIASGLTQAGYEVYGAGSVEEAQTELEATRFELVLLDLQLGGHSGLEVLHWLKARWPETQAIIITGHPSLNSAIEAVRQHAFDYLLKPVGIEEIVECVERALAQKRAEADSIAEVGDHEPIDMDIAYKVRIPETDEALTRRELEVLRLVAVGFTNGDIAEQLCISRNTVKTHLKNILRKFEVSTRGKAVARARELKLV